MGFRLLGGKDGKAAAAVLLLLWALAPAVVAEDEPSLRDAERRGALLYRADRTAWLTTDQLQEQGLVNRKGKPTRRLPGKPLGWITQPSDNPDIWHVAYLSNVDGTPLSIADGTVDFSAEPMASLRANKPPRPLHPVEAQQLMLRADALSRKFLACSRSYNTATLPEADGSLRVYLLPPQVREGVFPMGGFHWFQYDKDAKLTGQYAHTRSCIEQDTRQAPGTAVNAAMVSHITSERPNEFHVFMNLSYGLPIYVATSDGKLWKVEQGEISFVRSLGGEE
tara:strand:+ start:2082 stop:2921 length:840 start_codon:yes stop_codon:yes gene_type:complete